MHTIYSTNFGDGGGLSTKVISDAEFVVWLEYSTIMDEVVVAMCLEQNIKRYLGQEKFARGLELMETLMLMGWHKYHVEATWFMMDPV